MFLHNWAHDTVEASLAAMKSDFELSNKQIEGVTILLASYTYEDYSGDAFVLFENDGKLFEVNGGHCSCYGLEGQWEPEETFVETLEHRLTAGMGTTEEYRGPKVNVFADELRSVLAAFDDKEPA